MSVPLMEAVVPYVILVLNTVVFNVIRTNVNKVVSNSLLLNEIISTVELCADCAELGVVWEVHGNVGLSVALFLLCLWWCEVFGDAEACPCGPIEECLVVGRSFSSRDILEKLCGQLIGAYLTQWYMHSIWCWHFTQTHMDMHVNACHGTLLVSPVHGMLVEAFITFISRFVALETEPLNHYVSSALNSFITVYLVLFALNTTGGYFNPIMASALTLNCEGNTLIEHIVVYWIGSLLGGLLARWSFLRLHTLLQPNKQPSIDSEKKNE